MFHSDLEGSFLDDLSDLYADECLALVEVECLEEDLSDPDLRSTLERALSTTRELKRRIETDLTHLGPNPMVMLDGPTERFIQDALSVPENFGSARLYARSLIAMVQRGLRFEIAVSGTAIQLGRRFGYNSAVVHLKETGLLLEVASRPVLAGVSGFEHAAVDRHEEVMQ